MDNSQQVGQNPQGQGVPQQPVYVNPAIQGPEFHWNWGAFFYNIVFGFANKAWLTFLCLVPFLDIVWIFVAGAKGEKWAWNSGAFENPQTFRATMKSWNRAGLFNWILLAAVIVIYLVAGSAILTYIQNFPQGTFPS